MIYFLRPGAETNSEVLDHIEFNLLDNVRELKIAVAYFNEPRLTRAIARRHKLKYPTRLILNSSDILRADLAGSAARVAPGNILNLLELNRDPENIWIRALGRNNNGKYENMHHKFVVSDSWVYFGSLNWTYSALNNNFEAMCVSKDKDLVENFNLEFEHIWEIAEEICVDENNRITKLRCSNCGSSGWIDMTSAGFYCGTCGSSFDL
jgi:phosphatidylserine/phosphatidylglycerophosphate/cardiolipin synthase-like enzyme